MKTQKTPYSQRVLRKKNGAGGISLPGITLQSYSYQDSMVLAQKQKYRPMEQYRKPRNKPMHLRVPYFCQRRQEYTIGAKTTSSINGAGETGQLHVK